MAINHYVTTPIAIGIQARSTSTRLPGKALDKKIKNKSLLERIISAAKSTANYINRGTEKSGNHVEIFVLTPNGDPVAGFCRSIGIKCIEGSESDVLSRFKTMSDATNAKFIVRLTADCPDVPSAIISKALNTAIYNNLDYCSNVDPRFRTAPDGWDVEVLSGRALEWLSANAIDKSDREHVTSLLRSEYKPKDFTVGVIIGHIDLSHIKISVDTEDDLKRVSDHIDSVENKVRLAEAIYGNKCVHRF